MIKKYPIVKADEGAETDRKEPSQRQLLKRGLERMHKSIDRFRELAVDDSNKLIYEMQMQNIREDEFMKTVEKLKELEFAESDVLTTLFEYKLKDEKD